MDANKYKKNVNDKKYNPKLFFIIFVSISFIIAFLIGGLILNQKNTNKKSSSITKTEQVKIKTNELPDNPRDWKAYKLNTLGLELKLPEKLSKNKNWQENETYSDGGPNICFSDNEPNPTCYGEVLTIVGSSTKSKKDTDVSFLKLQGFVKNEAGYAVYVSPNTLIPLKNIKIREYQNENGLKILKILGEDKISNNKSAPVVGTPGKGYLGAIVITNNPNYPALAIIYSLESDLNEYEFDQIMESIKPIN